MIIIMKSTNAYLDLGGVGRATRGGGRRGLCKQKIGIIQSPWIQRRYRGEGRHDIHPRPRLPPKTVALQEWVVEWMRVHSSSFKDTPRKNIHIRETTSSTFWPFSGLDTIGSCCAARGLPCRNTPSRSGYKSWAWYEWCARVCSNDPVV